MESFVKLDILAKDIGAKGKEKAEGLFSHPAGPKTACAMAFLGWTGRIILSHTHASPGPLSHQVHL